MNRALTCIELSPQKIAQSLLHGSPGPASSNHWAFLFLTPKGACERSSPSKRRKTLANWHPHCLHSSARFTDDRDEEMHVKSNFPRTQHRLSTARLEPGTSWSRSRLCTTWSRPQNSVREPQTVEKGNRHNQIRFICPCWVPLAISDDSPANAEVTAATKNETVTAGPATSLPTWPMTT